MSSNPSSDCDTCSLSSPYTISPFAGSCANRRKTGITKNPPGS